MLIICFLTITVLCGFVIYLSWKLWQLGQWADEQIKLNNILGNQVYENKKEIFNIKKNIFR